jgi:hypothetical protein
MGAGFTSDKSRPDDSPYPADAPNQADAVRSRSTQRLWESDDDSLTAAVSRSTTKCGHRVREVAGS